MSSARYYACNLAGHCEIDEESGYPTQAACENNCRPASLPLEQAHNILNYTLEQALQLAPSDRVEVIYQATGIVVPVADSRLVLRALITEDSSIMASYPPLYPWAERNIYPQTWIQELQEAHSLAALQELERLGSRLTQDTIDQFLAEGSLADIEAYRNLSRPADVSNNVCPD
jgi:hypothetical protein